MVFWNVIFTKCLKISEFCSFFSPSVTRLLHSITQNDVENNAAALAAAARIHRSQDAKQALLKSQPLAFSCGVFLPLIY